MFIGIVNNLFFKSGKKPVHLPNSVTVNILNVWIKNRYFTYHTDDYGHVSKWLLKDPKSGRFLMKMSWFKHRDYIMIKHNYSPLDKSKSDYFRQRDISTSRKLR